ncbi:PA2169 family four-helix-bundle protein [Winogradskyella undariae]|uniref:ferritin-like domain-containing protein n=1 Tax=Winogradskyella TaxID=286104 RepID=UPI00156B7F7E|nr:MULTISPECIES: PA2169 family four-helix-bundle protein [Winogradskyella]NRR90601.1 PA2169 family four-helix-bundle protein [Winogradskyella undariae]QXP79561.1 PA2169 family four-helix-bundle protein [Winogradskyella sp. HaHa_3_26]
MATYTEEVGSKLNNLLEKNYDAEKGYKKAAENVNHLGLKNYFNRKAEQRRTFGHDLKSEIKTFGQEVDKGGSITGSAHRTWMDVKSWLSQDNEESMLEEAIRGEKASVDEYQDVLMETSLPSSTKSILLSQKKNIETDLSEVKSLENLK